jgi:hypothetical protein
VDRLQEADLVSNDDDAWTLIDDAFLTAKKRQKVLGSAYPFSIAGDHIEPLHASCVPYEFCLLSSLPEQFTQLRTAYPQHFRDLFEGLVASALNTILPGWHVFQTGWSTIATAGRGHIVQTVAERVRGKFIDASVFPHANDAQVDVAAVCLFDDARNGIPVLLGQCATGVTDWKKKLAHPNINRWCQAVQFSARPMSLVAVPFALDDQSFREAAVESNGLVLERLRICARATALDIDLQAGLLDWTTQAKAQVPEAA